MAAFQSRHLKTRTDYIDQANLTATPQGFECRNQLFVIGNYGQITFQQNIFDRNTTSYQKLVFAYHEHVLK